MAPLTVKRVYMICPIQIVYTICPIQIVYIICPIQMVVISPDLSLRLITKIGLETTNHHKLFEGF